MSTYDDTSYEDTMDKVYTWVIVGYVVGGILSIAFWVAVVYFIVRACKSVSDRPREVHVHQSEQPQIHYVIQQQEQHFGPDGRPIVYANMPPQVGPDGRPIVYANQPMPGQNQQYFYYDQTTPAGGGTQYQMPPPQQQGGKV